MNKQLNFRIPKFTEVQLELLCEKLGVDKTQVILWAINQMANDNGIDKNTVYERISKFNDITNKI